MKMRILNFNQVVPNAEPAEMKDILFLSGKYIGVIKPIDKGKMTTALILESRIQENGETEKPNLIVLTEAQGSKVISQTLDKMPFQKAKKFPDSTMILFSHQKDQAYMQLYYSQAGNFIVGHDYVKNSSGSFVYYGVIYLNRR